MYTLTCSTKTWMHRITFTPQGDTVQISHYQHDSLSNMTCLNGKKEVMPLEQARTYYRESKNKGYV